MAGVVIDDVLVNFVGNRQRVMPLAERRNRLELGAAEDLAGGVMRLTIIAFVRGLKVALSSSASIA